MANDSNTNSGLLEKEKENVLKTLQNGHISGDSPSNDDHQAATSTEKLEYRCYKCGMLFAHKRSLIRHAKMRCRNRDLENVGQSDTAEDSGTDGTKSIKRFYTFECSTCNKIFSSEEEVQQHIQVHVEEYDKLSCNKCGACFSEQNLLSAHLEWHNSLSGNQPTNIGAILPLVEHSNNEQNKVPKVAKIILQNAIDQSFMKKADFKKRMTKRERQELKRELKRRAKPQWGCLLCGRIFPKQYFLKRHLESHEKKRRKSLGLPLDKRYECDVCHKKFTTQRYCEGHKLLHTQGCIYECKECHKKFLTTSLLKKHEALHELESKANDENQSSATGETNKLECPICHKRVTHESKLKLHIGRMHAPDRMTCRCDQCGRTCVSKTSLERHKKLHGESGEPLVCPKCGKWFSHESLLKVHIEDHTLELKCNVCQRTFFGHRALKAHSQVHREPSLKHICEKCDKNFRNAELLKAHMQTHDSVSENSTRESNVVEDLSKKTNTDKKQKQKKRYNCDQCGKSFPAIYHLQAHKNSHTGDRPFQCQKCGKCYT